MKNIIFIQSGMHGSITHVQLWDGILPVDDISQTEDYADIEEDFNGPSPKLTIKITIFDQPEFPQRIWWVATKLQAMKVLTTLWLSQQED